MAKLILDFSTEEEADKFMKAWKEDPFLVIGPSYCDGGSFLGDEVNITHIVKVSETPKHEHDASCSFGNPTCPGFGDSDG